MNTSNSSKLTKPNKLIKPRSFLQTLQSQVTWFIGFRLHFSGQLPRDLEASPNTIKLLSDHERITRELKISVMEDYKEQASRIKAANKTSKQE